ncbi:MAG TPA: glutamate racemase [Solirubrobacterales bacterium]|nr:glutamate racemase [Solirubrobacterales bacterium]
MIGVFDSGVGGLTVLHECLVSLPAEDYLYVGDSGHFPYGTKTAEELRGRALAISEYLIERKVKLLVVACNSATAAAGDEVRALGAAAGVPVVTVIGPEAEIASAITENGRVGVLATPATVGNGAYHRALEEQRRVLDVTEVAAPDLAPMIQTDLDFDDHLIGKVRGYCDPLKRADVDTLILGCTHYPLVAPVLQRILGRDVRLVSAGHAIAGAIQRELASSGSLADGGTEGDYRFLVTGSVGDFSRDGTRFLQLPLAGRVEAVSI